AEAVAAGRAAHVVATHCEATLATADLVFAASGCAGIDVVAGDRARAHGGLVNVVDRPKLCDAITPALVDRDPLVVAIGTEGAAPVMAREVKTALETRLAPGLGGLVALAGRIRPEVADRLPFARRRSFWEWVFAGPPRTLWEDGEVEAAEAAVRGALASGDWAAPAGTWTEIACPAEIGELTLTALRALQRADLILYAPGTEAALELARRDAERQPLTEVALRAAEGTAAHVVALRSPSPA
ncbi:MAG: NAD(P)-dependent oxidoreductase, partial [Pseudomonadota bacterium]